MRRVDAYTIDDCGVPGEELMGNAARAVLDELVAHFPAPTTRIGIFCGKGNNGGDGLALAHFLWHENRRNFKVYVVARDSSAAFSRDANHYYELLRADGVEPEIIDDPAKMPDESFGVKVDALFGTGLDRELDAFWQLIVGSYDALPGFSLAVDCPSGLNSSTGASMAAVARADCTVTFGHAKSGFFTGDAREALGELVVADIGLKPCADAGVKPRAFYFSPQFFQAHPIPPRKTNVHKGHFGRIVILAGSHGFSGAAKMCGISALRAGAGLVRLFVPAEVYVPVASSLTEVMVGSFDPKNFAGSPGGMMKLESQFDWADLFALGSGLSSRQDLQDAAYVSTTKTTLPLIADAEGCFAVKRWLAEANSAGERLVALTPHLGEFAALLDLPVEQMIADPLSHAREFCAAYGCYLLVKSAQTFLMTPNGIALYPPAGSPALAKGGSGDVLAGAIAARTVIALKTDALGASPYAGEYLTGSYYSHFPAELGDLSLPFIEGIMRGYALFAEASHAAARLAGSEESVLAGEVSELLTTRTEFIE